MTLTGAPGAGDGGSEPRPYRIILVDPQRLFRQALRALLDAQAGFSVVGETGSAAEALELAGALKPDVVVTELHLADGSQAGENSGSALIGTLHSRLPEVAILVLTSARARDVAAAVRRAGARGYLLKEHGREELLRALREVTAGRWYRSITPEACPRTAARDDRYLNNRAAYLTRRRDLFTLNLSPESPPALLPTNPTRAREWTGPGLRRRAIVAELRSAHFRLRK